MKEEELDRFLLLSQIILQNAYSQQKFLSFFLPNDFFLDLFDNFFDKFHWVLAVTQVTSSNNPHIYPDIFEKLYARGSKNRKEMGKIYTPFDLAILLCRSSIFTKFRSSLLCEIKKLSLSTNIDSFKTLEQIYSSEFWSKFSSSARLQLIQTLINELSGLKVLDPSVGTGSLLLAYLEVSLDLYQQLKRLTKNLSPSRSSFLSNLLSNLVGIDIDPIALEICSLRLGLYIYPFLEAEEDYTKFSSLRLKLMLKDALFANEKDSAWDLILANPPFVDIKTLSPEKTKLLMSRFHTASHRINLFSLFLEYSHNYLASTGVLGFIIPVSFLYGKSYQPLRHVLLKTGLIKQIIRLPEDIFPEIQMELVILVFQKFSFRNAEFEGTNTSGELYTNSSTKIIILDSLLDLKKPFSPYYILQKRWLENPRVILNIYSNDFVENLLNKIRCIGILLSDICDFSLGLTPYDKYVGHTPDQIKNRVFHAKTPKDNTYRKWATGGDVERYALNWKKKEWISYGSHLGAPREKRFFISPRILVRQIISGNPPRIYATYTEEELYNGQTIFNLLKKDNTSFNLKYVLGILNSKLMTFYHANTFLDKSKRLFQKILIQDAKLFPIAPSDRIHQTKLVTLVDELLTLKASTSRLANKSLRIQAIEIRIDQLVYQMYNLTTEELEYIEKDFRSQF
ncbi:MAG: Eco57I restriction-modification methylase domain-containing protein [Candidatus Hermodarchaeota archaeon]